MEELATAHMSLMDDRGVKKLRVNLIKKGKTCGEVARELEIKDHMAVFYLINYNIEDLQILRSVSI